MELIKSDIMMFNYKLKHIKGEANYIAVCLSRRPTWLVGKDKKSDSDQDLILTRCSDNRDEFCLRVITEASHILKDNPALAALEEMGKRIQIIAVLSSLSGPNKVSKSCHLSQRVIQWVGNGPF